MRRSRRHRRLFALAAVALLPWLVAPTPVAAAGEGPVEAEEPLPEDPDEALEQLEANKKREAELAAELDTLAASQNDLMAAINQLEDNLEFQQDQLDEAQQQLANRIVEAQKAEERHVAKIAELDDLQQRLDEMVADAFISPPSVGAISMLVTSGDPNEAERKDVLRGTKIDFDVDVIELVTQARIELGVLAGRATDAEVAAEEARDDQIEAVADLDSALLQNQIFIAEVQARIQADFIEAGEIADQNVALAENLIDQASALASRLIGSPSRGGVETVVVNGIRVHKAIAPPLQLMLEAAEADGIRLGGGGYRSTEDQVALRRAHCGEDGVFTAPPSACSPPTARPGRSLHEIGLAIDFTVNGQIISSRSQPEFAWLAEHASEYGFYNLPSEPWHWSVNGD